MRRVVQVLGIKGGVGKSLASMWVMHWLLEREEQVVLIESDPNNPDVAVTFRDKNAYRECVQMHTIRLDKVDGWVDLADTIAGTSTTVVINAAAGGSDALRQYGNRFWRAMEHLKTPVTTLWVINRHHSSVRLLKEYLDVVDVMQERTGKSAHRIHVVRNLFYSEDGRFPTYDGSDAKRRVEANAGAAVELPVLSLRNQARLYDEEMTIGEVLKVASIGDRADMECWVEEVERNFGSILDA